MTTGFGRRRALVAAAVAVAVVALAVAEIVYSGRSGPAGAVARGLLGVAVAALVALAIVALRRATGLAGDLVIAERRLTAIGDSAHEWLWTTNADGLLTYSNGAIEDVVGWRPEEVVGRPVTDFLDKPSGWYDGTRSVHDRHGATVLVDSSVRPVLDRAGQLAGHEGAVRLTPRDHAAAERLSRPRREILAVLDEERLGVAFQPIVSLSSGQIIGVEALARFASEPDRAPDRWFHLATECGLAEPLELLALRSAFDRLPELSDQAYLSVNVSAATLLRPGFSALMSGSDVPLRRLMLEITEHESIDEYDDIAAVLVPLRAHGLRLAVDDAGSGFASFRHVVQLRPDEIKLDRDLVSGIDADPARRALAAAVVVFALEVGAGVIAEGIETAAELDVCQSLSIDAGQGFFIAAPSMDVPEWARQLVRRPRRMPAERVIGSA